MKLHISLTIFLLGFFFVGCSKHPNKSKDIATSYINMDVPEVNSKSELSSLFSDFTIIELESGIDHYIKEPARIRIYNNLIYIFDRTLGNLLIFNNQGKFIKKVLRKGKGPGETVKAYDFDIDTGNKQLLILDLALKQTLHFSLDGDYLFVEKNDFQSFYLSSLAVGKIAYYIGYFDLKSFNLQIKEKGKKFKSLFPFPDKMYPMHFIFSGYMAKNQEGILYSDACSDNVYQIYRDGTLNLKYSFDFGPKAWNESDRFDFNKFFLSISRFETDFLRNYFEESKEGLVFEYQIGNQYRTGYYLFANNKLYLPDKNLIYNAYCNGLNTPRGITDDGKFISYIEPYLVKKDIVDEEEKGFETGFDLKLRNQIMNSDLETGIFLVLYRLRQNEG